MIKTYYRRITESLPQARYFAQYFILVLAISLIFSSILAAFFYVKMLEAKSTRKETVDSFKYWGEVSKKHPNSPDALFEAGYYALRLGDKETAGKYLDEALKLDPSFEKAKNLEKQIANR